MHKIRKGLIQESLSQERLPLTSLLEKMRNCKELKKLKSLGRTLCPSELDWLGLKFEFWCQFQMEPSLTSAQHHHHSVITKALQKKMAWLEKDFLQDSLANIQPDLDLLDFPGTFSFKLFLSLSAVSSWCWHHGHTAIQQFNHVI